MKTQAETAYRVAAVYTEGGFTVERAETAKDGDADYQMEFYEKFSAAPYQALYQAVFEDRGGFDVSLAFLVDIAKHVVLDVSRDPEVDISRTVREPEGESLLELLRGVPYVLGCEFVSLGWIKEIYSRIACVFDEEFAVFSGGAEEYFKSKDSELNVAGRVYFHLVEHKDEEHPFAFLATYSEGIKDNVKHILLKTAVESGKSAKTHERLLKLLSAVSRAADKSEFISELIESGELFSPPALYRGRGLYFPEGNPRIRRMRRHLPDTELLEEKACRET